MVLYFYFTEQDLCNGTNCVHGCRVGVNGTKECFCPMGYVLAEDRISCKGNR